MVPEEIKVKKETDIGVRIGMLMNRLVAIRKDHDATLKSITEELSELQDDYIRAKVQENHRVTKKGWFKWFKRKKEVDHGNRI